MADLAFHEARREALKQRHPPQGDDVPEPVATGGVHHLALISSDLDATIDFYTEILQMRLTRVVSNRDDPASTHIFLDMGGGNMLAFFDFPEHGPERAVRGIGAMHHVALKAEPEKYRAIVDTLDERRVPYSLHGSKEAGAVYLRDPDDILIEVTTGLLPRNS